MIPTLTASDVCEASPTAGNRRCLRSHLNSLDGAEYDAMEAALEEYCGARLARWLLLRGADAGASAWNLVRERVIGLENGNG